MALRFINYQLINHISFNIMKGQTKSYHHYSLSFYQKEKTLSQVTGRVKMGFHNFEKHQKLLKSKTIQVIIKFTQQNKSAQKQMLKEDSEAVMDALFDILKCLNSDRDLMELILPTIDSIFIQERQVLRQVVDNIRNLKTTGILTQLRSILSVQDHRDATYESAARITCILLGQLPRQTHVNEQKTLLLQLLQLRKRQARRQKISDFGLASSVIHLTKHGELAQVFLQNGGTTLIIDCLSKSNNDIQLVYYALLNIWMLSFLELGIQKFISIAKYGVIKQICQVLQKISRQKITRISFMIFKNIQKSHPCLELMIDNKLLKIVDTLLKGNIKDTQLIQQIKAIGAILQSNIKFLSSFDKYCKEVNSQMLEWSSVHTQRFWTQNKNSFQFNDFQMIKKLKSLLDSKRPLNVSIACYDLGQFCRFYANGKKIIQSLQIKDLIMEKARYSEDKNVRQQALLSLQKIMIQNWQSI